jgi:hypothetical protein
LLFQLSLGHPIWPGLFHCRGQRTRTSRLDALGRRCGRRQTFVLVERFIAVVLGLFLADKALDFGRRG